MRVVFVVLHFITFEDTLECVKSLPAGAGVIVVNNGSPNGEIFASDFGREVFIINSPDNLGFANGHNLGFRFAKRELNPDFIVLLNNDVVLPQPDFDLLIQKKFLELDFDILGPDIISLSDGGTQSPSPPFEILNAGRRIRFEIFFTRVLFLLNFFGLYGVFQMLFRKIVRGKRKSFSGDVAGVKLHGAALIFSRKFIDRFDGLFDKTFLFKEEEILSFIAQKESLTVYFTPDLKVFHKEDSAANALFKNDGRRKNFFILNCYIKSLKEFLNLIRSY